MSTIKVSLLNIINNWDASAMKEFEFDYSDKALFQEVNNFKITIQDEDTKKIITEKITRKLYELLINNKNNWINGKRCRYCFNDTVELDDDQEFIECNTCKRIYRFTKYIENIPLPHPDYIYLADNNTPFLYSNNSRLQQPLLPIHKNSLRFDQPQKINSYFDLVTETIKYSTDIEIFSLLQDKPNAKTLTCILFYDIYEFMEKMDVLNNIKQYYTKLFWYKADYNLFNELTKNTLKDNKPNFTKINNNVKKITENIKIRELMISEYEKIPMDIFNNIQQKITKINIKTIFDKDIFINLLNVFQTIQLNEEMPYVSYFVDELNEFKTKVWRPIAGSDLHDMWSSTQHKKSLRFKIKLENYYFTLQIDSNNNITIFLPSSIVSSVNKDFLEKIKDKVNIVINKIKKLPYQTKFSKYIIENIDENINNWGNDNSNTFFFAFNINNTIETKEINLNIVESLLNCLENYVIFDKRDDNKLSFFYIYDVQDKQNIRYEKFLRNAIQRNLYNFSTNEIENLKIIDNIQDEFKQFFNLNDNHSLFLFNKWLEQNKQILNNIQEGFKYKKLKWSIISGIYITFQYVSDNLYKLDINGIKKWQQEKIILSFIRKLFTLSRNIKKYPFFEESCKLKNKLLDKRNTPSKNLKQSLKRYLPNLFWDATDASKKNKYGYARKCQKKEQPLIFTSEEAYNKWLSKQQPQNKTNLQKIFTRECTDFTDKEIINILENNILGYKAPKDRKKLCLDFQQYEFQKKDRLEREGLSWTINELKNISQSLNLPIYQNRDKLLKNIDNYFMVEEFKIKEGIEDIMPNPHTFIIKEDNRNFYITCPNGLDNTKSRNAKYIGFLDIDEHPKSSTVSGDNKRKFCVPCCKERINDVRTKFCSGIIDYDSYLSGTSNIMHSEYIKTYSKYPLEVQRYGHLHPQLFHLFNKHPYKENKLLKSVNRLGLIKNIGLFLRTGVIQSNFSFISAVLKALNINNPMSLNNALSIIKNSITDDLFKSLNSGTLFWKYNANLQYYKSLFDINNPDYINEQDIWDIISREQVLISSGINIIIFEIKDDQLHLICPQNQEINHFYDISKPTVFLIKHNNSLFEPIINYLNSDEQIGQFTLAQENLKIFADWYKETCSLIGIDSNMTAKSLIPQFNIKKQLVDAFNKVQFLVNNDNFLIPTMPSGLSLNIPRESSDNIKKYIKSFSDTYNFLKQNNFNPTHVIINNNYIKAIVVKNNRYVPIILEKYNNQLPVKDNNDILDSLEVDKAIINDFPKTQFIKVNKQIFREEAYQRFKLLFSHFINNNNISQKQLLNSTNKVFKNLRKNIKLVEQLDFENYEFQNIRNICGIVDDFHCHQNKLIIFKNDIDKYEKKLIAEIKKSTQSAHEIFNKRVDIIVNPLIFLNDKWHVYI